jgi:hypothetical protein
MTQRTCRFCGRLFIPQKPSYWWCTFECHERYREREARPTYSGGYDVGFRDGYTAGYQQGLSEGQTQAHIPPELWRQLISLAHPDRYDGTPLVCAATTCTMWLLQHRPTAGEVSQN